MIRVNLGSRSYDIAVVSGHAAGLGPFARQRCPAARALVVTDPNVAGHARTAEAALRAAGYDPQVVAVPPG